MSNHAILYNKNLYLASDKQIELDCMPDSLEQLLVLPNQNKITHLWVIGQTYTAMDLEIDSQKWDILPNLLADKNILAAEKNTLISLYGRKRGKKYADFNIIFLRETAWSFAQSTPARALFAILELEAKIGIAIGAAPSGVGMRKLKEIHAKNSEKMKPPITNLFELPFNAKPLLLQRPFTSEESAKRFLIMYDKRGAYPSAVKSKKLGVGEPVHKIEPEFKATTPGTWLVEMTSSNNNVYPFSKYIRTSGWLQTSEVAFLIKNKYQIHIKEAHVFEESFYLFRQWVSDFWELRIQESGQPGQQDIKRIMNDTLGLFASKRLEKKARIDWNREIVATLRVIMLSAMIHVFDDIGLSPNLGYIDAVVYAADSDIAYYHQHDNGILGGYTVKWKLEMTDEIRNIVNPPGRLSMKISALNAIAASQLAGQEAK